MGSWLVEALCLDYEVGVYDRDVKKLRFLFNSHRFTQTEDIRSFQPDMMINAVSLQNTITAFRDIVPMLPGHCILSDITSVKNGLQEYYHSSGRRFVSTHPMFGPTFANVRELAGENAVIIKESDPEGKAFFRDFYEQLNLRIHDYSFTEHDQTIAYSLSIPFSSSLVFAACMKELEAPGTTFRKHLNIARGLLSEDDYLLSEILLNKYSLEHVQRIHNRLDQLIGFIRERDQDKLHAFFRELRGNIGLSEE